MNKSLPQNVAQKVEDLYIRGAKQFEAACSLLDYPGLSSVLGGNIRRLDLSESKKRTTKLRQ